MIQVARGNVGQAQLKVKGVKKLGTATDAKAACIKRPQGWLVQLQSKTGFAVVVKASQRG